LQAAPTAAARLVAGPGLDSVRTYVPPPYRFWPLTHYRYLLAHDATTTPVQIVRVMHVRRDLPKPASTLRG
jgi:plasmid stabilization system protein ParE